MPVPGLWAVSMFLVRLWEFPWFLCCCSLGEVCGLSPGCGPVFAVLSGVSG